MVQRILVGVRRNTLFDPTPLLFFDEESKDASALIGDYRARGNDSEFERWLETNVHPQKQKGYCVATVKLPLGDIQAEQFHQLASLSRKHAAGRARITHQQNLALRWVPENALYEVWEELNRIGLGASGAHEISDVVSCPGTDSCKLGITSSMGLARAVSSSISELATDDPLIKQMHVKMSGCPNGCGQHHIADIGFHGAAAKAPGGQVPAYELFLGGSYDNGDARIGQRVKAKVPSKRMPEAIRRVLSYYQGQRNEGEEFKNFVARVGAGSFEPIMAELSAVPELNRESLDYYIDWDKTVKYILERGEGECAV